MGHEETVKSFCLRWSLFVSGAPNEPLYVQELRIYRLNRFKDMPYKEEIK